MAQGSALAGSTAKTRGQAHFGRGLTWCEPWSLIEVESIVLLDLDSAQGRGRVGVPVRRPDLEQATTDEETST